MASSSSSSIHKIFKYDVFISFRGEDTRKPFVDHLYHALQQHHIGTFMDDNNILRKGKRIDNELIKSIQESKSHIIVFSKNYASSSWCLDELVKIMECQRNPGHWAHPVFYDVEPTEIRKQIGQVGRAFAKLKDEAAAGKWRQALKEAAVLVGWELRTTANGYIPKLIQKIVDGISRELLRSIDKMLIGMETRLQYLESSLAMGLNDVRMIGIKGMGGSGKTTLARAIFDRVSLQFEGVSFVVNVREASNASFSGLTMLQKRVLSEMLNDEGIKVTSVSDGVNKMKRMLCGRKVLLVLDDVDHIDQLEALAGASEWFKPGSRIIITTRDEQVLKGHGVNIIHDVSLLTSAEAISLFSRYAFGKDTPIQGYEELSKDVVYYAAGLPLTIKVLGSVLRRRDENAWIDVLERLKTTPLIETQRILELSYISLEDDYKEIFLDIACFMVGWEEDKAIRLLESSGFHAINGLRVLEQKSLITIDSDGVLGMHYHIEEMGKNIVRRFHQDDPSQHSLLWVQEEIENILANDMSTDATRAIVVDTPVNLSSPIVTIGFGKMKGLRALDLVSEISNDHNVKFDQVPHSFPNALGFLSWLGYPYWSLPKSFEAKNLVRLEMSHSKIEQLWEEGERKVLYNLRFLDLRFSSLRTLDARMTPNLEMLDLEDCKHLEELHAPIGCLQRLQYLNLSCCRRMKSNFLFIKRLESLEVLCLTHLFLEEILGIIPEHCNNKLRELRFRYNNIVELPSSIANLQELVYLDLYSCRKLRSLPESICGLRHLKNLKLYGCSLEELPEDIGLLKCLEKINLSLTRVKHLPNSICMLKHLKTLNLSACRYLEKLPEDLGELECLEKLILKECRRIREIPGSIGKLNHLRCLNLMDCVELEKLPEELGHLECLEDLNISGTRVEHLPRSCSSLKGKSLYKRQKC